MHPHVEKFALDANELNCRLVIGPDLSPARTQAPANRGQAAASKQFRASKCSSRRASRNGKFGRASAHPSRVMRRAVLRALRSEKLERASRIVRRDRSIRTKEPAMIQPDFKEFQRLAKQGNLVPVYDDLHRRPAHARRRLSAHRARREIFVSARKRRRRRKNRPLHIRRRESRRSLSRLRRIARSKAASRVVQFEEDPVEHSCGGSWQRYRPVRVPGLPPLIARRHRLFRLRHGAPDRTHPARGARRNRPRRCVMMFYHGIGRLRSRAASRLDRFATSSPKAKATCAKNTTQPSGKSKQRARSSSSRCRSRTAARRSARSSDPLQRQIQFHAAPQYLEGRKKCKDYIRAGDIFQVVVSQRFSAKTNADPFEIYRALRVVNPSPYLYFLQARTTFPSSAARPKCWSKSRAATFSTARSPARSARTKTKPKTESIETHLLADPKERAEHIMLVDLGRNDLGRVCEYGIGQGRAADVRRALLARDASRLDACADDLREDVDCFDALMACFPAGTRFRRAKSSRHGNHRRARAHPPRHLRRRDPVSRFFRQSRLLHRASAPWSPKTGAPTSRPAAASSPIPSPSANIRRP